MAGDSQPKTKAELLRELQSIQHLLDENADSDANFEADFPALDDDDIPLLDTILDDELDLPYESDEGDEPLASNAETLDALNAAYAALTGELEQLTGDPEAKKHETTTKTQSAQQPVAQATPSTNAPSHAEQAKQAHRSTSTDVKPRPHEPENRDQFSEAESFGFELADELGFDDAEHQDLAHTDPSVPAPLPGQQSLFEPVKSTSLKKTGIADDKDAPRPAPVTKASGENPFLPQHIRERLRGNQPLPKGEFLLPMTPPAYMDMDNLSQSFAGDGLTPKQQETLAAMQQEAMAKQHTLSQQTLDHQAALTEKTKTQEPATDSNTKAATANSIKNPTKLPKPDLANVINEVVEEFLPLIETRLRERLSQVLRDEGPTEH